MGAVTVTITGVCVSLSVWASLCWGVCILLAHNLDPVWGQVGVGLGAGAFAAGLLPRAAGCCLLSSALHVWLHSDLLLLGGYGVVCPSEHGCTGLFLCLSRDTCQ